MFRCNPKANYQPNRGRYFQILSNKDLYKQTIVISSGVAVNTSKDVTFPVRFLNIFLDYPLGQMCVGDKLWTKWNNAPLKLWQTQSNFVVWCTSSACLFTFDVINCYVHFKMFRCNPKANYQPNRGRYFQILSNKDLYKQTIVISSGVAVNTSKDVTFPVRFLNIFLDYPLGQMCVGDKLWTKWNNAPLKLWQTQSNFVVWCTSSACVVSSVYLNYKKHPMIRAVYHFHVYYHVTRWAQSALGRPIHL